MDAYDAVIVGSGPNGLAAGITLAREGMTTLLIERSETLGGGARSASSTLPGFVHDVCSAVHPLAVASPFFRGLALERFGLKWVYPELPLVHCLHAGEGVALHRSVEETARHCGADFHPYKRLFGFVSENCQQLLDDILKPPFHFPQHPLVLARFGLPALLSAKRLSALCFGGERAPALFAGLSAHASHGLDEMASAAYGLTLGMLAHAVGWPLPVGGAGRITAALVSLFQSLGGKIEAGRTVSSLRELPSARITMLDVSPSQFMRMAAQRLPAGYMRQLKGFRYGPGVFKADYALHSPIPWSAEICRKAGTIHIGGTFEEVCSARRRVLAGEHPARPFVLLAQPTLFDPSRAPEGKHIAWTYCHVPRNSTFDMTERLENQIERFAPGFRDCIIAKRITMPAELERKNPNLAGGSIDGGMTTLWQTIARPVLSTSPYRTPLPGVYLCSSSTPPGGGVHGMCGHQAATVALKDLGK